MKCSIERVPDVHEIEQPLEEIIGLELLRPLWPILRLVMKEHSRVSGVRSPSQSVRGRIAYMACIGPQQRSKQAALLHFIDQLPNGARRSVPLAIDDPR